MKSVALLGATGSIGKQTVDVISQHSDKFELYAMSFGENVEEALRIIKQCKPKIVAVKNDRVYQLLKEQLDEPVKIISGKEALSEISADPTVDIVVNAVMGSVGLRATLTAIEYKKQIAFANKETLVTAGHLVMEAANQAGVPLLPVDSEHSAIYQALNGEKKNQVQKIILTASGGSFRDKSREELEGVTVEDALNHPNWSMGAKITVDSATMMNKGLEVIEAHWLFGIPYENIEVILHRESIIHSMVEYVDHSIIAQLGTPDMRIPIQYALTYPDRYSLNRSKALQLTEIGKLHFEKMDEQRFPCLTYAYRAGKEGGSLPTVLNAANEAAVALFLKGKISFLDIEKVIERAMNLHHKVDNPNLEMIELIDSEVRKEIFQDYL
ncbi:1-deoxy-D-xylulose-5-phosphate reductoisomerase [Gracilibacillus halotolerans]|uniref:1-deoxy-D-xylulose 5-phosphate reductoisomerase n=1 Tax=Gracilibacillus halotolerans TaxID=74386 RepID=A0A841RHF9_9BACI|nr:1-deoxy-D-xylulose-5-phosphate reductoisomerase [Gracilibacillus halotolerans]MBB6511472.1 1-deoxy-D-xylulose-5-phosphate reductoisomerase [Gracilibacillus halotolerans]